MISKFRIIEGGGKHGSNDGVARAGSNATKKWQHYKCGACSDELGFPFSQLHEVRIGTMVTTARGSAGEVAGGQRWLACPRCHQLRFQLADNQSD